MSNILPRRIYIDKMTPAELAIFNAMAAVEKLPADTRLTAAVMLLQEARNKVADFVDDIIQVDIKEFTSPEHVARKVKEAIERSENKIYHDFGWNWAKDGRKFIIVAVMNPQPVYDPHGNYQGEKHCRFDIRYKDNGEVVRHLTWEEIKECWVGHGPDCPEQP